MCLITLQKNQIPKEGKSADGAILCSRFRVVNEVIWPDKIVGAGLVPARLWYGEPLYGKPGRDKPCPYHFVLSMGD
jgi:hypothetical protein